MTHPLPDHGTDTETLARRIDRLHQELESERRRRGRLERFGAIACLLVVGAAGIAATSFRPVADVVRTHRLEIVDDSNRIVMLASAAKHGGRIDLWDDAGINSARLGGNGTGGDLALWNRDGRQVMAAYADGPAGRLEINARGGGIGVALAADARGGTLTVADGNAETVGEIRCGPEGGEFVAMLDGRDAGVLSARRDGGRMILQDGEGRVSTRMLGTGRLDLIRGRQTQISMLTTSKGGGLRLSSVDGKARVTADAAATGGLLQAHDRNDFPVIAMGSGTGGSGIRIRNGNTVTVAAIGVDAEGKGAVEISDEDGDRCGSLMVTGTGGSLALSDEEGRPHVELGGDVEGGLVRVYDRRQQVVATMEGRGEGGRIAVGIESKSIGGSLEARDDGPAIFSLYGPSGRAVAIAATANGGLLNLLDLGGNVAVAAGAAEDGPGGVVAVRNEKNTQVVRVGVNDRGEGEIEVYDAPGTRKRKVSAP